MLSAILELEPKFEAKLNAIMLKVCQALAQINNGTLVEEIVQNKNERVVPRRSSNNLREHPPRNILGCSLIKLDPTLMIHSFHPREPIERTLNHAMILEIGREKILIPCTIA